MFNRFRFIVSIISLYIITMPCLFADTPNPWQLNMEQGVTPISHDIYDLHTLAMLACALIGIAVFGVMIYALIHHRKSKNYQAAVFHSNTFLEIIWSVIPFLILVGLAIPATKILIRLENNDHSDLTIKVVGYQWKWQYQYMDTGVSFFSTLSTPYQQIKNLQQKNPWYLLEVDKPLVVPINKKIRFLVTSNDVIHSWWVPQLGIKRDAIPGFMYESWAKIEKPGVYRGQCAELCGINHAYMPIVVQAVTESEFANWLNSQKTNLTVQNTEKKITKNQLMEQGKEKYEAVCAACHKSDGSGLPPMYPALKGSSVALGHPITRHIDIVLNGIPGSAMPGYKSQLTDQEIAAIVTYERNAWENNTNEVVQSNEVSQARAKLKIKPKTIKQANKGGLR